MIAFGWYGGKYSHLGWLLPLLPRTSHYCDPPYPHESRGDCKADTFEMSNEQHENLAEKLHMAKGKVAISGYKCPLMDQLYRDWKYIEGPSRVCHSVKTPRKEVLWVNYEIQAEEMWFGNDHSENSRVGRAFTCYRLILFSDTSWH